MKNSVDEGHRMERRVEYYERKGGNKKTSKSEKVVSQTKKKLSDTLKGK